MIELKITEEQKIAWETAKKFAEKEIKPFARLLDEGKMPDHEVYSLMRKTINTLYDPSWINIAEDVEKMRAERDPIASTLIAIEIAKACPSLILSMGASLGLCGGTILTIGTREQKQKYCVPIFKGEKIGCWALTEPEAGSDAFALKTRAEKHNDYYILNGTKTFITNAPYADIFIVYAKTDPKAPGHKGVTAFILEREMEGLSTSKSCEKMGMRGSPTGQIYLEDVRAHESQILGTENRAFYELLITLREERTGMPGIAIGIIERVLEDSIKYAKTRVQFGQTIGMFQAIQHKLARMYIDLTTLYAYMFLLMALRNSGLDMTPIASAAKVLSGELAVRCCLEAIQIHGGYGYMKDTEIEMFMRDAKLLDIGGGTTEIQLNLIALRYLLLTERPSLNPFSLPPDPYEKIKEKSGEDLKVSDRVR